LYQDLTNDQENKSIKFKPFFSFIDFFKLSTYNKKIHEKILTGGNLNGL